MDFRSEQTPNTTVVPGVSIVYFFSNQAGFCGAGAGWFHMVPATIMHNIENLVLYPPPLYYCIVVLTLPTDKSGGDPRNPLGPRWLDLSIGGGGTYGIHGNSNPASIGTYASSGCIRMYDKDIIWLYDRVPLGTPVTINKTPINQSPKPVPAEKPRPEPIKLLVGGKIISLPDHQKPEEKDKHIFIPLQPAMKELGYEMVWHSKYSIVEIKKQGKKREVTLVYN